MQRQHPEAEAVKYLGEAGLVPTLQLALGATFDASPAAGGQPSPQGRQGKRPATPPGEAGHVAVPNGPGLVGARERAIGSFA
jgi:hypothetical protein